MLRTRCKTQALFPVCNKSEGKCTKDNKWRPVQCIVFFPLSGLQLIRKLNVSCCKRKVRKLKEGDNFH